MWFLSTKISFEKTLKLPLIRENQYKGICHINAPWYVFPTSFEDERRKEEGSAIRRRKKRKEFSFSMPSLTFATLCVKWWISYKASDLSELSFLPIFFSRKHYEIPCHKHTARKRSKTIFTIFRSKKGREQNCHRLRHQMLLSYFAWKRNEYMCKNVCVVPKKNGSQ